MIDKLTARLRLPLSKTDRNKTHVAAITVVGETWHKELRPRRFTQEGGRLLGFARRSVKYNRRKRKAVGHTDPLRFSRRSMTLSESYRVYATRRQVRVTMPIRAFNYSRPGARVNMADEFRRIAPSETRRLEKSGAGEVERLWSSFKIVKTTRV